MAKASWQQLQELGLRIRRGQIPEWKIPAVFGIVEADPLGKYLRLVEEARKEIISAEQVQALIEGEDEALGIYNVTVDYGLTLEQMIEDTRLGSQNVLLERFNVRGEGHVKRELVTLSIDRAGTATTKMLLTEIARRGLRPAKVEDLLALLAQFHAFIMGEEERYTASDAVLVALGSYGYSDLRDHIFFPSYSEHHGNYGNTRVILVDFPEEDGTWCNNCSFLAVRKDAA
ncbi:MAG: hypothetical protein WC348_01850 [Patescibacteria group bacterium]|jgi:hypothetical protein